MRTRPVTLEDTPVLHRLYQQTERYFNVIAAPMPLEVDVHFELESALSDPRRFLEFILPAAGEDPVGYLDLKLDYPHAADATINLLLIAEPHQSGGYGSRAVHALEERLRQGTLLAGRTPQVRRLLAGIYGDNPGAVRFWERLGYRFAVDARPVLCWYAKDLQLDGPQAESVGVKLEARSR